MYGDGMGTLRIKIGSITFWEKSGNQGDVWFRDEVTIRLPPQTNVFDVSKLFHIRPKKKICDFYIIMVK